ncbi:MAG: hypothetical protein JXD23_12655 [Spirochaetales bacterium]|nr:hypothetical protein [Spirochaetales bacterium]
MKKIYVVILVLLLVVAAQGFALKSTPDFAFGIVGTCNTFSTIGAMLTLHIPGIPLFIGFGADFYNPLSGQIELTATIDFWLLHTSGKVCFYLGLGLYGAMTLDALWYAAGLRLPLGLQIWPLNNEKLEMFLEVAPAWVPLYGSQWNYAVFQAQIALGFRIWLERGR